MPSNPKTKIKIPIFGVNKIPYKKYIYKQNFHSYNQKPRKKQLYKSLPLQIQAISRKNLQVKSVLQQSIAINSIIQPRNLYLHVSRRYLTGPLQTIKNKQKQLQQQLLLKKQENISFMSKNRDLIKKISHRNMSLQRYIRIEEHPYRNDRRYSRSIKGKLTTFQNISLDQRYQLNCLRKKELLLQQQKLSKHRVIQSTTDFSMTKFPEYNFKSKTKTQTLTDLL